MIVDKMLAKARFDKDSLSLLTSAANYKEVGVRIIKVDFPIIEVALWWHFLNREILLRIIAEDYDYLPVAGYWIDETGTIIVKGKGLIPHGYGFQTEDGHPHDLQRAWFCFRGWREYHDHPGHQDVSWSYIRQHAQYRIPGIILQLHSVLNSIERRVNSI